MAASGAAGDGELTAIARAESLSSSAQVRAAAIRSLSARGAEAGLFLELARDKKKEVRVAAAAALCRFEGEEAARAAIDVLAKDSEPDLVAAMRASSSGVLAGRLLDRAREEYAIVVQALNSGKRDKKAVDRCLSSLAPLPVLEDSPVLDFLVASCEELRGLPAGEDRNTLLKRCLLSLLASPGGPRRRLLSMRATEDPERIEYRLYASLFSEEPAACFERFRPLIARGKKDPHCAALLEAWRSMNWVTMFNMGLRSESETLKYDIRWREEFCGLDEPGLVCRFDPAGMPTRVMRYLEKKAEDPLGIQDAAHEVLGALARAGSGRVVELCLKAYDKSTSGKAASGNWKLRYAAQATLLSLSSDRARELSKAAEREKDGSKASFLAEIAATLAGKA